jgi:CDP-glucose 4,6-dehydratase
MVSRDFWQGKRVLVTGHTGFKGSWLCLWLQHMGAVVQGYSLAPPTSPSLFIESQLGKHIESTEGDIRNLQQLSLCIQQFKPELVFHLAAQSLVRLSYESPLETYSVNVMGTLTVFEAVRQAGTVRALINCTSDKCYENQEWLWGYRETEAMGGFDPYSSSKGCAELLTSSYRRSFFNLERYAEHGCALASVRAGNVVGGGDWAQDRLVPDALKAFANKQSLPIRNPHAIRPWQHVLDPLSGYIKLAEQLYQQGPAFAQGWNFGPKEDSAQSVAYIVNYLASKWGEEVLWNQDKTLHPHEAHYLKLDCSKAKTLLGWQSLWDLKETLDRTVDWYKAWLLGDDMYHYCLAEINEYMDLQN